MCLITRSLIVPYVHAYNCRVDKKGFVRVLDIKIKDLLIFCTTVTDSWSTSHIQPTSHNTSCQGATIIDFASAQCAVSRW